MPREDSICTPAWLLARFPPDQRSAVDYLRALIDEEMLRLIAEANYAQEVDKHFAALKPIWMGADFVELDSWFPMEVLELIRWSEPDEPESKPGATGETGHKVRAFACSVLLATPNFDPEKETLIQMIDSVFSLGREAQEAAGRFLTWCLTTLNDEEDRPFFVLALAAIVQSLDSELSVAREEEVADWILQEEESERRSLGELDSGYQTCRWLFGLSFSDMRNDRWRALIQTMQDTGRERPLGQLLVEYNKDSPRDCG